MGERGSVYEWVMVKKMNFHLVLALLFVSTFSLTPFCYGQEIELPAPRAIVDQPAINITTSFYSHYI